MNTSSQHNNIAAMVTQPTVLIPVTLLVVAACLFSAYQRLSVPNAAPAQTREAISDQAAESALDSQDIIAMNLFGAAQATEQLVQNYQDIPETNLRLALKGAFAHSDPKKASALIAPDLNSKAELFFIDESLPGGAELDKVYPDYVVIRRNGQLEKLQFLRSIPNQNTNDSSAYDSYEPPEPVQNYNSSPPYQAAPAGASSNSGSNSNAPVDIRALIQQQRQK